MRFHPNQNLVGQVEITESDEAPFEFSDKEKSNGTQTSVVERQARQLVECLLQSSKERNNGV